MADLFDMSVAGYGFHITGHLIALIALIIACLAITGHISYSRDRDANFEHVTLDGVTWGDSGGAGSGRMVEKHIHAYFSGALATGAFAYMVNSPTADQTVPNRVILPAGSFPTKATFVSASSTVLAANTTFDIGFQPSTNNTAISNNAIFDGANLGAGTSIAAGVERVVLSGITGNANASTAAFSSAGLPTSSVANAATVAQYINITAVGGALTSGTYRLDIWYMSRE